MISHGSHPLIAMWSHPRSMSTATERIMRERGDLECLHEPFMYYYYIHLKNKELPLFEVDPNHPVSFENIIIHLKEKSESKPVFFKDMSYYVLPEIYRHREFVNELRHLFLIRDPRKSILSYHKLDPKLSRTEIGLESQWELFEWLGESSQITPLVIQAEAVQNNPVTAMRKVWEYLELPVKEQAFEWSDGSTPKDWQAVSGWHGNVQSSTGIIKPKPESEEEIKTKFSDTAEQSPELYSYLEHHWTFYQKLKSISQSQFDMD